MLKPRTLTLKIAERIRRLKKIPRRSIEFIKHSRSTLH